MTIVRNTSELPNWFSLENYECFENMEEGELREQTNLRRELVPYINLSHFGVEHSIFDIETTNYLKIISGNPLLEKTTLSEEPALNDEEREYFSALEKAKEYTLESDVLYLEALSKFDIDSLTSDLANTEPPVVSDSTDLNQRFSDFWSIDLCLIKQSTTGPSPHSKLHISVDLESATDDEIANKLLTLLPAWRHKLEIPEPERISSRADDIDKIRDYRLIPYFDLLAWSFIEHKRIKQSVLAIALYPDGRKGETEIKQTIRPFLEKIFSSSYKW